MLNALDTLAGDNRFLEIRKRRPEHRTLARFEEHARAPRVPRASRRARSSERTHDDVIRQATEEVEKVKRSRGQTTPRPIT